MTGGHPADSRWAVLVLVALVLVAVSGMVAAAPENEPNDSRGEATTVTPGDRVAGTVAESDQDWFRFEAERGETIEIPVWAGTTGETYVALQGPDGQNIAEARGFGGSTRTVGTTVQTSGTYYLLVEPEFGNFGDEYNFTVRTFETDGFEPNEDRGNATQVEPGTERSGLVSAGDADYFRFTAERGETIEIPVRAGTTGETYVALQGPAGNTLDDARGFGGATKTVGTTVRTSGTYHLLVEPDFGNFGDEYNFTVRTYETDGFEPNEDRGNATRIEPGSEQSGILSVGDRDYYRFSAERGQTIEVAVQAGTTGETYVALQAANGSELDDARGFGGSTKTVGTTVQTSGTYYLLVEPDFGNFGDEYTLTVNVDGTGSAEATTDAADSSGNTATSDGSGSGFGFLLAGGSVLVSGLLAHRRT